MAPAANPGARPPRLAMLRLGPVSFRVDLRIALLCLAAVAAAAGLSAWALTLGSFPLSVSDVLRILGGDGDRLENYIVWTLRLPRILVAVLVGMLMAISGAIFQGLVRNALVSPDIIGIFSGAALAASFAIIALQAPLLVPAFAFGGAVAAATLLYALAWRGGISVNRMILVGIGLHFMFAAAGSYLDIRYPVELVASALAWTAGSVYATDWADVRLLATAAAVLVPVATVLMWQLRILQLGDLPARSLGQAVETNRLALIATGCAAAALAVSVAGPVLFLALMAPHVGRMIAGPMSGGVLVFTAGVGAVMLLGADMVAQHALPVQLPVGIVTAGFGAPFFLFLLWRTNARL